MSRRALARLDMFGHVVACFSTPQHAFYESVLGEGGVPPPPKKLELHECWGRFSPND